MKYARKLYLVMRQDRAWPPSEGRLEYELHVFGQLEEAVQFVSYGSKDLLEGSAIAIAIWYPKSLEFSRYRTTNCPESEKQVRKAFRELATKTK